VVSLAILAVIIAMYGNIKLHPDYLVVFLQYFIPAIVIIYLFLNRNVILQYFLDVVTGFFESIRKLAVISRYKLSRSINKLTQQEFVYFSKGDDISILNKVMIYVSQNEITKKLRIVTVLQEKQTVAASFLSDFEVLDRAYPDIKIEYMQIEGTFGPELIERLSKEWNIPQNFMFISSPGNRFTHRIAELGGVRLII
jgi:hypothetical protein